MQSCSQELTADFKGFNRQFDQIEISLIYDKSNRHLTLYDSYNAESAAGMIKSVDLANISEAYGITNTKRFDTSNNTQKHLLYKQFIAWNCNGCSVAPLSDYINNPIFQELLLEKEYFGNNSDQRISLDLRDSLLYTNEIQKPSRNDSKLTVTVELKNVLAKKKRLRVWGYTNEKYLFMFVDGGLTLKYKTYTIRLQDNALEK